MIVYQVKKGNIFKISVDYDLEELNKIMKEINEELTTVKEEKIESYPYDMRATARNGYGFHSLFPYRIISGDVIKEIDEKSVHKYRGSKIVDDDRPGEFNKICKYIMHIYIPSRMCYIISALIACNTRFKTDKYEDRYIRTLLSVLFKLKANKGKFSQRLSDDLKVALYVLDDEMEVNELWFGDAFGSVKAKNLTDKEFEYLERILEAIRIHLVDIIDEGTVTHIIDKIDKDAVDEINKFYGVDFMSLLFISHRQLVLAGNDSSCNDGKTLSYSKKRIKGYRKTS